MKIKLLLLAILFLVGATACASSVKSRSYIQTNSVEFDEKSLPEELLDEVENKKVVLFGEGHGIKEFPEMFYDVVREIAHRQSIIVGLEFPKDVQSNVDQFFTDGDIGKLKAIPFFSDSNYHSGRASKAMIELLKSLRLLKNVSPFCFDVAKSDSSAKNRDTLMAKNIIEKTKVSADPIIILAGNIHSRLVPGVPWDPNYPTMGAEVLRLSKSLNLDNVTNVLFRYSKGSAWQCRMENNKIKCDEYPFGPSQSPYATEVDYALYFLSEKKVVSGHYNTLFIREVSASFPYFN